jgi:hypothetical protein
LPLPVTPCSDALLHASLRRRRGMALDEARRRGGRGALQDLFRQRLSRAQARRQCADHRFAERALVVRRQEAHQLDPVLGQARRIIAHRGNRFQFLRRHIARHICVDHDADALSRAERNHHAIAGAHLQLARRGVVEQSRQRHVQRHRRAENSLRLQGLRPCG